MEQVLEKQLGELDSVELFPMSDIHLGSRLCNMAKFHQFVQMILDAPNRYIIANGDLMNNNITGAVGTTFEDEISPREQKKLLKQELDCIKDRIIVMLGGNHERRSKKSNDENPLEDVAEHLGVPYREEDCFIKLRFGKDMRHSKPISYCIYVTHGNGGGKRPGSTLNNVELLSLGAWAEIYIMGHAHKKIAHKAKMLCPDLQNNVVREVEQLYVVSSSFQEFGGYAKQKMLRPSSLGVVPIYLSGKEKYFEARI